MILFCCCSISVGCFHLNCGFGFVVCWVFVSGLLTFGVGGVTLVSGFVPTWVLLVFCLGFEFRVLVCLFTCFVADYFEFLLLCCGVDYVYLG